MIFLAHCIACVWNLLSFLEKEFLNEENSNKIFFKFFISLGRQYGYDRLKLGKKIRRVFLLVNSYNDVSWFQRRYSFRNNIYYLYVVFNDWCFRMDSWQCWYFFIYFYLFKKADVIGEITRHQKEYA